MNRNDLTLFAMLQGVAQQMKIPGFLGGARRRRQTVRQMNRETSRAPRHTSTTKFDGRMTQWKNGLTGPMCNPDGTRNGHGKPRGLGRYDWKRQRAEARKAVAHA